MQGQKLDQGEILSIRWAYDDPNPVAQDSISRADKDALSGLLTAKGVSIHAAPFEYPTDYHLPSSKRVRLENGTEISMEHPELAYPNTDAQYDRVSVPTELTSLNENQSPILTQKEVKTSWAEFTDDDTGATYYYNELTGQSSWDPPQI